MRPEIDLNLVVNIASGIMLAKVLLSITSWLDSMWQDNWKITILIVLCYTIVPATIFGAWLGYFGWIWLIPGFIAGTACHYLATHILVKEEEGKSEVY